MALPSWGGRAPYLVIVLLRVLVELVQGPRGVQGVRVCLKGPGQGCMTHGGQKPCPRGLGPRYEGPPPISSASRHTAMPGTDSFPSTRAPGRDKGWLRAAPAHHVSSASLGPVGTSPAPRADSLPAPAGCLQGGTGG